jgi:hypothetical protein
MPGNEFADTRVGTLSIRFTKRLNRFSKLLVELPLDEITHVPRASSGLRDGLACLARYWRIEIIRVNENDSAVLLQGCKRLWGPSVCTC